MDDLKTALAALEDALGRTRETIDPDRLGDITSEIERAVLLADLDVRVAHRDDPVKWIVFDGKLGYFDQPVFDGFAAARAALVNADQAVAVPVVALMDALEEAQRQVLFRADSSERFGSDLNSIRYLKAAAHLDNAAESLIAFVGADADCDCVERGPRVSGAKSTNLGVDETGGRFAGVEVVECGSCRRTWLRYHFELESFSGSGQWYAGIVTPDEVRHLTARDAPRLLAELPWYLAGGSYFDGKISRRSGPLIG